METIENVYSFVHAKYGAKSVKKHLFRDQLIFLDCFEKVFLGLLALRARWGHIYYVYMLPCSESSRIPSQLRRTVVASTITRWLAPQFAMFVLVEN